MLQYWSVERARRARCRFGDLAIWRQPVAPMHILKLPWFGHKGKYRWYLCDRGPFPFTATNLSR